MDKTIVHDMETGILIVVKKDLGFPKSGLRFLGGVLE